MQSDTNYTLAFHALFPFTSTLKREIDRYFSILKKNHLVFFKCTRNDKNMGKWEETFEKTKTAKANISSKTTAVELLSRT